MTDLMKMRCNNLASDEYRDTCPHGIPYQPWPETCDDCDMEEMPRDA